MSEDAKMIIEEKKLVNKAYFEELLENPSDHPVRVLGELYLEENKKEIADLSYIRFAQGEVYFQYKDYETAIFKWENITNELGSWAKKNMADAYFELGLLDTAEGIYLSVEDDNTTLKMETGLQLLAIYNHTGEAKKAIRVINEAVALNPDYPNITEIARNFFEEHHEWDEAINLASNEALRTWNIEWYDRLIAYVSAGYTDEKHPSYFNEVITMLISIDPQRFEQLVVTLWARYKGGAQYLDWIHNFNTLFLDFADNHYTWRELSKVYQESYLELMSGTRLIKDIQGVIPNHLSNWLKVAKSSGSLFAASSVMAWSEMFPSTIPSEGVRLAEDLVLSAPKYPTAKEECLDLFKTVINWATRNGIEPGNIIKWNIEELVDEEHTNLLFAGVSDSGKSDFINQLLGETILKEPTSSIVSFKHGEGTEIHEVTDTEIITIETFEQFQEAVGVRRQNHKKETVIDFACPSQFLKVNELKIMDIPGINRNNFDNHPLYHYVSTADSLLFFLSGESPLTDKEKEILKQVNIQAPNLPIHFVMMSHDLLSDEEESRLIEKTITRIRVYYPHAELFMFSPKDKDEFFIGEFSRFIRSIMNKEKIMKERVSKLQHYVRSAIHYLLDKRIEMEDGLIESVRWNEELVTKLRGATNQVRDLEDEKVRSIKNNYLNIKKDLKSEAFEEIPKILRSTSDVITKDSDFAKVHLNINAEMNRRVYKYLEDTVTKKFYASLEEWIAFSKAEFDQAQYTLDEMSAGFNTMYGEERIHQKCDFKVLDDWQRDANRMTSGFQMENVNFLLRLTPAQLLLKSAGKLLSVLPQNNSMLHDKYKSYIENEDYQEATRHVVNQFFKQFEMFEKSLDRDVRLFFKEPINVLNEAVEEALSDIETNKLELEKMRVKPEVYRDPLNIFEVRLRQYEWMAAAGNQE